MVLDGDVVMVGGGTKNKSLQKGDIKSQSSFYAQTTAYDLLIYIKKNYTTSSPMI